MAIIDPIKIEGLAEFRRSLKAIDSDLPKALRLAGNEAAEVVVGWARPRIPSRTGRAAGSVKARSTQTEARVVGGGAKVSYYPWLDFGGRVGPRKSVRRPFVKSGRYIYAGYAATRKQTEEVLYESLVRVVELAGFAVTDG